MIDIIIPAYNAQGFIDRLLCSICMQTAVKSISVTIVNDGDGDYSENIKRFPLLNIKELSYGENKGCGFARQYGIDHTSGELIIFCDADDILYSCLSVETMATPLKNENIKASYSSIMQEKDGELTKIAPHHFLWLHGACYRRSFLEQKEIRFFNNSAGEDGGFNKQVKLFVDSPSEVYFENDITYLWTDWNKEGRINTREFGIFKSVRGLLDNCNYVYEKALKLKVSPDALLPELLKDLCTYYVLYNYYYAYNEGEPETFIQWLKPHYDRWFAGLQVSEEVLQNTIFEVTKNFYEKCAFIGNKYTYKEFEKKLRG